jgi:hypothetical protein
MRRTTRLLIGWPAIARYIHRSARQLPRDRRVHHFPAFRIGHRMIADPVMIQAWRQMGAR